MRSYNYTPPPPYPPFFSEPPPASNHGPLLQYQQHTYLFLVVFFFAFCLSNNGVYAFGAGNIPSFAYMEGRAFRHGDIEDALQELIKKGGGGFALASMLSKGSKFGGLDIKRVYFGNWLRDYSQAVDIASLKKLPLQTIINLCMALGFLAHGYATHEFEVTPERLGVYLPVRTFFPPLPPLPCSSTGHNAIGLRHSTLAILVICSPPTPLQPITPVLPCSPSVLLRLFLPMTEHIDNPKGYGEGEDARKYNPNLRPPVDPQELEIDPRTGMKNYIANESGRWDTSKALVRRTLEQCIHRGRQHRANGQKADEYEAYRLLGQLLHTLEDYPAHSNFCELALISMGYTQVFPHVGDQVRVQAPNGKWVAPIVTGSFGSSDFIHSLLGEATDHLASVTDLNRELDKARSKSLSQTSSRGMGGGAPLNPADALRDLFFTIPGGGGSEMSRDLDAIERIRRGLVGLAEEGWVGKEVLTFRDSVVKKIEKTIEKIPGLGPLIEKIMDSISVFVFTTLEPFLKPILKAATSGLSAASGEVIDNHDQYEAFNDPRCSDPTHSFLSKDHFNLILNEPAGHVARIIITYTVKQVVKAWDDTSVNVHQLTEDVLQCLFHPDFHNSNSQIQREMLQYMREWINKVPNQHSVIQRLSKESVRNHQNTRLGGEGGAAASQGSYAESQAHNVQHAIGGYVQGIPGVAQVSSLIGGVTGGGAGPGRRDMPGMPGGAPGFPGAGGMPSSHAVPSPPPPMTGQAASYYGGGSGGYAPPPGGLSGYAPPSGPPPSSYGGGSGPSYPQHEPVRQGSGYAPAYDYAPPGVASFPGAGPSFPTEGHGQGLGHVDTPPAFPPSFPGAETHNLHGHHGHHAHHQGTLPSGGGYAPPSGPPPGGFPAPGGGYGMPDEGAPPFGFPGADPYQQQQQQQQYPHGQGPPPQFPGAQPNNSGGSWFGGGQPGAW
ncbi:heterokaryon incompatibility protein Het-C-domain-containing protein [Gymnopilus junonius]|uniref:Heterokaryon incompatibility protein Het-C-domain-containing protein n=1 Tax=Gymnopilus junonius TaxID=109634 RepID=A0A9P5NS24_GYMJU|nr:heterokaryon incompatibility protein Het-C-domain-containing protein [Gymnopilus junonius]